MHWSADERQFEDAVAQVLRSQDDITLRRFLAQCEADWRQLITDRASNCDVVFQLLDRLTCLAALALRWDRQPWTVRCVETFERMYTAVLTEHGSMRHDLVEPSHRLMTAIINRIFGLGVVAVENKAWALIPELVIRRPDLPQFEPTGHLTNWIRHTTTEASRAENLRRTDDAGRTYRIAFLEATITDIAALRCVNADAPRIERFRSQLAQFDALATMAVWGLAPGDRDHPYYPWHRAYEPQHYEPALVRLLRDDELRGPGWSAWSAPAATGTRRSAWSAPAVLSAPAIGASPVVVFPADDQALATVLLHLQQFSQREFAGFDGGWPYMATEIRDFLATVRRG